MPLSKDRGTPHPYPPKIISWQHNFWKYADLLQSIVRRAKAGVNGSSFIPALALIVMRSKYISISSSPIGCAGKRG